MTIAAEPHARTHRDPEAVFQTAARNFTIRLAEKLAKYLCSLMRRAETLATPETECLLYGTYWFRPIIYSTHDIDTLPSPLFWVKFSFVVLSSWRLFHPSLVLLLRFYRRTTRILTFLYLCVCPGQVYSYTARGAREQQRLLTWMGCPFSESVASNWPTRWVSGSLFWISCWTPWLRRCNALQVWFWDEDSGNLPSYCGCRLVMTQCFADSAFCDRICLPFNLVHYSCLPSNELGEWRMLAGHLPCPMCPS